MKLITLNDMLVIDPDLLSPLNAVDDRLNHATLTENVIIKLGGREPIYTHTMIFKRVLQNWLTVHAQTISKLVDTTLLEYNPIDNYNRIEEGTRQNVGTSSGNEKRTDDLHTTDNTTLDRTGNRTEDHTGHVGNSGTDTTTNKGTNTETNKVSAYDQEGYSDNQQNTTEIDTSTGITYGGNSDTTSTNTTVDTAKDTGSKTGSQTGTVSTEKTENDSNTETYSNHMHGNIGVTTTQKMIAEERKTVLFNVYDWITDHIDAEMFLGIWN